MKLFYQIFLIPYFLHHSQTTAIEVLAILKFEYHTYLHHSQTKHGVNLRSKSLNTIHIYIILKRSIKTQCKTICLNTIHIYIILKLILIIFLVFQV